MMEFVGKVWRRCQLAQLTSFHAKPTGWHHSVHAILLSSCVAKPLASLFVAVDLIELAAIASFYTMK